MDNVCVHQCLLTHFSLRQWKIDKGRLTAINVMGKNVKVTTEIIFMLIVALSVLFEIPDIVSVILSTF